MSDQTVVHQVTVKVLDADGFSEFYTIRAESVSDLMKNVKLFKDWLKANGYTPDAPGNGHANGHANGAAPVCQYHGEMKRSKKFAGWYCPSKMGDGSYCKEKVMD